MEQEKRMLTFVSSRPKIQQITIRARSISTQAAINNNSIQRQRKESFLSSKNEMSERVNNNNYNQKRLKISKFKQSQPIQIEDQSTEIRAKNSSIFSNSSNGSSIKTKYSQILEDQCQDCIVNQPTIRIRQSSNCSSISNTNSFVLNLGIDQIKISKRSERNVRLNSPCTNKGKVESNIDVQQKQKEKNFNTQNNLLKRLQSQNSQIYKFSDEDSVIDYSTFGNSPQTPQSKGSTKCSPRQRVFSFQSNTSTEKYTNSDKRRLLKQKSQQKKQRVYFYDIKKYLFDCYDEYDQKRFENILNQDSPLDNNYIKDFIEINERFISDNLSFQITSLEKMPQNNFRVYIDCLLNLKIAKKDSQGISNYVKQLEDKYNEKQKNYSKIQTNKLLKFDNNNGKAQLNPEDFVWSPFDLVVIVDYNNEFQQQIHKTVQQILDFSQKNCRICFIFPDFSRGKCVRTNLLLCTTQNKQIMKDILEQHLFNCKSDNSQFEKDYELNEYESKSQEQSYSFYQILKSKAGFHEIALNYALLTLTQKTYTNYQQSIFWISDGQNSPIFEKIEDKLNYFSTQNNSDFKSIDENLIFQIFQYGSKTETDDTLYKISQLKRGRYYLIRNIDDLYYVVNQAMIDLNSNVAFSTIASVDLTKHSQINLKEKEQFRETLTQIRPRETSISKSILFNQQLNQDYFLNQKDAYDIKIDFQEEKNFNNLQNIKEKIVDAQRSGQKLFSQQIRKLYGGEFIWQKDNNKSISIKIQHLRHGQEKSYPFSIDLKPSNLLAQSEIAEFTIANGTFLFFASPNKFIIQNKKSVQYLKKFCTCQAEIHFYLNKNKNQKYISSLNFHTSSRLISFNQMNLEKNQSTGLEIMKYINFFESIESLEEALESYLQKNKSKQEFIQQIQKIMQKNGHQSLGNIFNQLKSLFAYLSDSELNIVSILNFKSLIQSCKLQCCNNFPTQIYSSKVNSYQKLQNKQQYVNIRQQVQEQF